MSKRDPIRRGAWGRGLSVSLAGARAGGAFALDGALRRIRGDRPEDDARLEREAQRFTHHLGSLKGSYVKVGQIFALLGEHFLPRPLTDAFHTLESETQPLDWPHIEPVLVRELGDRLGKLDVNRQPVAAASLAQVHRAQLKATGEVLALKVQYPDLASVVEDDFDAVVKMLRLARWIPATREFDSWLETMREQLRAEIDYPREQRMAARVRAAFASYDWPQSDFADVRVPHYFDEYCSERVLTMAFVEGHRVTSRVVAALPQEKRNALGKAMLRTFFLEVFDMGLMQVDPNFGNFVIGAEGDSLTLLDFGSVWQLDPRLRSGLADAIRAGQESDDELLLDALVRLGCLRSDSSDYARDTFKGFIRHLLEPLRHPDTLPAEYLNAKGDYCWARSDLLGRAGRKAAGSAASRDFTIPSGDFALIARKLTGVFTFIAVLEAEFNAWDVIAPFIAKAGPNRD